MIEMCKRPDCFDLLPQTHKECYVQNDFPNCSKQATALEEKCRAPWPSASSVPAPVHACDSTSAVSSSAVLGQETIQDNKRKKTSCTVKGTPSSFTREAAVCLSDSTPAATSGVISGQETIQENSRKKRHAVEGTPSSSTRKPPVYVSDSTSSESFSAISGQEMVQSKNRKETSHVVEGAPSLSSGSKEPPVCVSNSTSSEYVSAVFGQEVVQDKNREETRHAVEGTPSSSAKEPLVYVSDSTSSEPLSASSEQAVVEDKNWRETRHSVEGNPSSSTEEPPVCVCDSTSSESLSAISEQAVIQDRNRKKTRHAFESTPSSSTKEPPVYVSDNTSSEPLSSISGQELVQDKSRKETRHTVEGTSSSPSRKPPIYVSNSTPATSLSAISGQVKCQKETCASNVGQLGKALTAKRATWSVMGRAWTASVVLAVPGESAAAEESGFVSANPNDTAEDHSGESKHCEKAAASPASDSGLENQVKFCMLADKASEGALAVRTNEHSDSVCHVDGIAVKLGAGEAESPVVSHVPAGALVLGSSALRVAPHVASEESTESTHAHESQRLAAASITLPVALSTATHKQEMSSQTFEDYSPAALKPLSYVCGLLDRSEVSLSGNLTRAGVTTAAEPFRCCQKVGAANQAFANNNAAIVKSTIDTPTLPENDKVDLRENSAMADRTLFTSPPTLLQEERSKHHAVSDHYHAVRERMGNLEKNEGDVPESFTAVNGTSSSELLCPQEMQAGSGTVGSHAAAIEEPVSCLPHEDEVGLRQSSVVTSKTSTILPLTLVQEEEAGHQAAAAERASSLCLLPNRSDGGAPVSFMGTGGRSSPEFPTRPHEQQANFETVGSHSPVVEKPISGFSGMPSRDEVGPRESSDVAGKLSSVRLPTLPQQDGAVHQTVSDHSCAVVEPANHTYCLPDRTEGGAPEFLAAVSDTLPLGPPMCSQELEVRFENLDLPAAVEKPTRDLCGLPDEDGASLRQSPLVASETSPRDLVTPLQKEQETSEYSANSNNSSLTKPCSDVLVACGLSSLELPAPSADHMYAVENCANISSCVPDTSELDLQGNSTVASELSLLGSPKSLPERLEDSQKNASYISAPVPDYISEESLLIGAEVSLEENSDVNSTTPLLDTPKTLQEEQGRTENTVDHHGAVGVPCHTNQRPSLSSTSAVCSLGRAEDSLSATLRIAESMSKLESSQRKVGYHNSAPPVGCTEASWPVRGEEVNSNILSAETPGTLQIELGGTYPNQASSSSSTSEVSLLVSDEDSLSATLHIAETMSKLATDRPGTASTVGSFQQIIIPPSTTAITVKEMADVRGTVGMPAYSGKGGDSSRVTELTEIPFMHSSDSGETIRAGGSGHVVPTVVAVPLAGVLSDSADQAGLLSSSAVRRQAVVVTAARIVRGARKMERIVVTLPSRNTVAGQGSQAVQSANTRAGGLKRPHSSTSSENEGLSGDATSRLDSRAKLAIIKKLCPEDRSRPVGRTSSVTKGGAHASKSATSSKSPKQVGPAGRGKQATTRSRQPVAPRMGRNQASSAQRKGKLLSKHPEHIVPDVLHPVPSPLSSELSSASSKPSNDGSLGPSDSRSGPYLSAKLRSTKSSAGQSSNTSASERAKFMQAIQNRILQATTSAGRLPGYHSALASRPLYRDEVPVITSKRKRIVDKGISGVEVDLDHYIAELSTTKDLEQYDSVLSDLFDSCT